MLLDRNACVRYVEKWHLKAYSIRIGTHRMGGQGTAISQSINKVAPLRLR